MWLLRENDTSDVITCCGVVNGNSHVYFWFDTVVLDIELILMKLCLVLERN